MVLKDEADAAGVEAKHKSKGAKVSHSYRHALKGYAANLSGAALATVKADLNVRFVATDRKLAQPKPRKRDNAQFVSRPINRIDAELSSTISGDGKGAVKLNVGVIDNGVDSRHAELDVRREVSCAGDDESSEYDDTHGTAVAGLIAARDDKIGAVGVAPGAALWSADVFQDSDEDVPSATSETICGIDFMTSTRVDSSSSNDIAVVNASLATTPGDPQFDDGSCGLSNNDPLHMAICRSVAAGITYVFSAGNESTDLQCCVPPAYDEVLAATAIGDYDGQPGGLVSPAICPADGFDDSPIRSARRPVCLLQQLRRFAR